MASLKLALIVRSDKELAKQIGGANALVAIDPSVVSGRLLSVYMLSLWRAIVVERDIRLPLTSLPAVTVIRNRERKRQIWRRVKRIEGKLGFGYSDLATYGAIWPFVRVDKTLIR